MSEQSNLEQITKPFTKPIEQPIPKQVQRRLDGWFTTFWAFTICHYFFGIGGVLASTIAAASNGDIKTGFSITAAVCMAIIGFVKPDASYRKHVVAWRLLDEKVNLYRFNLITIKELLDGMTSAEKALDQSERNVERVSRSAKKK